MSSPTRSQLSLNKFRCLRPQAAQKLTTRRCRICPEMRRVGLFAMTADSRRHHVPQQSDEKERHCDRIDPHKWDKSPSPRSSVVAVGHSGEAKLETSVTVTHGLQKRVRRGRRWNVEVALIAVQSAPHTPLALIRNS